MDNTIVFEGSSMFGVPTQIVDEFLHAPDVELRLILFLLRHQNKSFVKEDLLKALNQTEERIDTAFEYWNKAGVLHKTGNRYMIERPRISALEVMRYSPIQIAARIDTDPAIKFLSKQAQTELAKPLTESDASLLISIVDWYGIKPEAAALMIHYCASKGNASMSKIQKMAVQWSELGICTMEQAEAYISQQQQRTDTLNRISALLGISHRKLTESEQKAFLTWVDEYGYGDEMIQLAYEKTVNNTGKYALSYMNKILTSWHEKGLRTVLDIQSSDRPAEKRPAATAKKKRYEPSVKIDTDTLADSWAIIEADLQEDADSGSEES